MQRLPHGIQHARVVRVRGKIARLDPAEEKIGELAVEWYVQYKKSHDLEADLTGGYHVR